MFRLTCILLFQSMTMLISWASPVPMPGADLKKHCISDRDADELLTKYSSIFEKLDEEVAKEVLTEDYTVYSESLNYLFKPPGSTGVGKPFSTTRDEFITVLKGYQATLPPGQKNIVLDSFHSCDKIFYRYTHTAPPDPTAAEFGFDELYLTRKGNGKWKVKTDYTEYNNVATLVAMRKYPCNASNTPS